MNILPFDKFIFIGKKLKSIPFLLTSILVILTLIVHQIGLTWWLSVKTFDLFIQLKSEETIDSRIVLVGFSETDIARFQNYPFTESQWASVLQKIESGKPDSIGFDVFRDFPFPRDDRSLNELFAREKNIFGITKLSPDNPSTVAGPPVLAERNAIGDITYFPDLDGITRRAYLWTQPGKYPHIPNLSLKLVLHYLKARGIEPTADKDGYLQLKGVSLTRMSPNFGDYHDFVGETGGYPILLNWRKPFDRFPAFTLSEVLAPGFNPSVFRDKIVFVGVGTDSISVQDFLYAPAGKEISGIQYLANLTDSLLSAVLDGRPLMKSWNNWQESLWIAFWLSLFSLIFWRLDRGRFLPFYVKSSGILVLILAIIWIFAYFAFLNGYWIPIALLSLSLFLLFTLNWIGLYIQREREERQRLKKERDRAKDYILAHDIYESLSLFIDRFVEDSYDWVTRFNASHERANRSLNYLQTLVEDDLSLKAIDRLEIDRCYREINHEIQNCKQSFNNFLFRFSFFPRAETLLPKDFYSAYENLQDLTRNIIVFLVEAYQEKYSKLGYLDNVIFHHIESVDLDSLPVSPVDYIQIVTILIDNALVALSYRRFDGNERPRIQLTVVTGRDLTISVRDNGIGLPRGISPTLLLDKFTSRWPEPNERQGNELYRCDRTIREYGGTLSLRENDGYTEISASIPL